MGFDYRKHDPQHKEWSLKVRKRDKHKCRFPGCKSKKPVHAHHIIRYADAPLLRYILTNGISLCRKHHNQVTGHEYVYAPIFAKIIYDDNH